MVLSNIITCKFVCVCVCVCVLCERQRIKDGCKHCVRGAAYANECSVYHAVVFEVAVQPRGKHRVSILEVTVMVLQSNGHGVRE
jgi:hypothetical protein